jgi:hypothetical protein
MAPSNDWTNWDCVNDPKNYGSAEIFTHDGEIYMVGQRQLTDDGAYDTGKGWGMLRAASNRIEALTTGKRCSVWRYIPTERQFGFVMDLPSKGDVCSPAVVKRGGSQIVVYGHSSDLDGPDLAQKPASERPNRLYRYVLELAPGKAVKNASF